MVDRDRLEICCTFRGTGGSNPSLSAIRIDCPDSCKQAGPIVTSVIIFGCFFAYNSVRNFWTWVRGFILKNKILKAVRNGSLFCKKQSLNFLTHFAANLKEIIVFQ